MKERIQSNWKRGKSSIEKSMRKDWRRFRTS
jgi:hypothetical protein